MCDPTTIALAVAGQGLQFLGQRQANKRQEREANAARIRQNALDEQAQASVRNATEIFELPRREATQAGIEERLLEGLTTDIERSRTQGEGQLAKAIEGETSPSFDIARARALRDTIARAARLAELTAKVQAPSRLRQEEAFELGDIQSDLGTIRRNSIGQANADSVAIQDAGRVNPLLLAGGQLLSALGTARAGAGPRTTRPRIPSRTDGLDPASVAASQDFGIGPTRRVRGVALR